MTARRGQGGTKFRWWIAAKLNQRPDQCWAELVMWALNWYPRETPLWRPSRPIPAECKASAQRTGECYCGKLKACAGVEP